MKLIKYFLPILTVLFLTGTNAQDTKHEEHKPEPKELADGTLYGTDISSSNTVLQMKDIFADLSSYEGKTVVVEGTISEVCKAGGCWTVITDGENYIRALTLHKFIIPKDMDVSKNYKAVIEGEFAVKEITEDQAKHFAEESGKPTDGIVGPQKMYRIKATGIKILK